MNDPVLSLLTGLIAGGITAVVTYLATLARARLDLSIEYDKELRQERLAAYQDLWKRLKPLARYSAEQPLTRQVVRATSESMRDWYFDVGGIYLSQLTRGPYFDLKEAMQLLIDSPEWRKEPDQVLPDPALQPLLKCGTTLREALSNDIGTRRQSFL
jgi:hypothetical protein